MVKLPAAARVPVATLAWPRASRLIPARFQALDCFERILEPGEQDLGATLIRLAELTTPWGTRDLTLMDPAQVIFGPGAGWIMASYAAPRPGRFSTARRGACYVAEEIETGLAEVRHHLQESYRREGVTEVLDLEYRALTVHLQGSLHDIRGKARARAPWSAIYDPGAYAASQAFAGQLLAAGAQGLAYDSVRRPGGACAALFDPNLLRACRHDTYLVLRWDGAAVTRVLEQRILALSPRTRTPTGDGPR